MVIKNETKQTVLSSTAAHAESFKQKLFGLIPARKTESMVFQTRFGIHTFFMKFPIDILILDKQKRAVVIKSSLKPNQIFFWNPKFEIVVELPEGTINNSSTKLGDQITFNS